VAPLNSTVRPVSTWRRKAQELYPSLAGQLETWERVEWDSAFFQILSNRRRARPSAQPLGRRSETKLRGLLCIHTPELRGLGAGGAGDAASTQRRRGDIVRRS